MENNKEMFRLNRSFFLAALVLMTSSGLIAAPAIAKGKTPTESGNLKTLPGFKVELIYSSATNQGSWICMAVDPKGRLIISPQQNNRPLLRVSLTKAGGVDKVETIPAPVHEAMGMCFAHDSLYVNARGPQGIGLYRLVDENRNDQFDTNEFRLLKKFEGAGEHGYHAVTEGPDGMIYVMNGNHTKVPEGISINSPHKNYGEDLFLPRMWDANGHAVGVLAPGGYVLRTDPEGKNWELMLGGFRNQYDFDFNTDGELFTFDSDMEWDWGMPWYRPTRVIHCVTGGEYGWRSGSGKWPEYYADALPAAVNIGIGSPTGVKFGTKSKFPKKYQQALFAMDWSYGRILAVHLKPDGASYTGSFEEVVKGKPLNVSDLEFGKDGAMYFITGGRGTQSGLYRVSFVGDKKQKREMDIVAKPDKAAKAARELRHQLESLHGKTDPRAVDFAWPHLNSTDRFLRHTARIAIESQPVATWKDRALSETNMQAGLSGLIALARCGGKETQRDLIIALGKFPFTSLTEAQQLEKLRIAQLSFARQGRPDEEIARAVGERMSATFPTASDWVNREMVQLMVYLNAPDVIAKSLERLDKAATLEEQIHYVFNLRNVKTGWTLEQRQKYFSWFTKAKQGSQSGPTYPRYVSNRFELETEYKGMKVQYDNLQALSSEFLRDVLPGFVTDTELASLTTELNAADQRLTALVLDLGENHPDIKRIKELRTQLNEKIDARIKGIMKRLETQVVTAKARFDSTVDALKKARDLDQEKLTKSRPYNVWTNQAHASQVHPPELVQWFKDVGRDYGDGASYAKFLLNIRKDAIATLTSAEREALRPILEPSIATTPWKSTKERKFVKEWAMTDLESALGDVARGRNFENGKAAFNDAQCTACHRFANEGGSVGPELTGAGSKYSRRDLLESMIEPSKVISDQFQNSNIWKKDGDDVSGRIIDENKERIIVLPNMLAPEVTVEVPISEIARREPSKVSAMPTGLLNQLTQEEILDLLAYIETMGKAKAANFKQ